MNNERIELGDLVAVFTGERRLQGIVDHVPELLAFGMWIILDTSLAGKNRPVYVPSSYVVHLLQKPRTHKQWLDSAEDERES